MAHHPNKRRRSNYDTEHSNHLEGAGSWAGGVANTWTPRPVSGYTPLAPWQPPEEEDLLSNLNEYPQNQLAFTPNNNVQPLSTATYPITPASNSQLRPNAPSFIPQRSSSQQHQFDGYNAALPAFSTEQSFLSHPSLWPSPHPFVDMSTIDPSWFLAANLRSFPPHDSSSFDLPPDFAQTLNADQWYQPQIPALTPPPSLQRAPSIPAASMRHISRTFGQLPTPASTDRMLGEAHTVNDPNRVTGQLPPSFLPDTPTPAGPRKVPPSQSGSHSCTHPGGTKPCTKTFVTQAELKKHQQIHLPKENRLFKCHNCVAYFHYQKDLNRHLNSKAHRKRTREKQCLQFLCPVPRCGHRFTRKDNFGRHLQVAHPDLVGVEPMIVTISPAPTAGSSITA